MSIFNKIMHIQNNILKDLETTLNLHFERVVINDSTGFALPKEYANNFPGAGGIKKSSKYIKLDILELSKSLIEGETIELKDV